MTSEKLKTTRFFSIPLLKQDFKSNLVVIIAITAIMCMLAFTTSFALSLLDDVNRGSTSEEDDAMEDFYMHLTAMAVYNELRGTELSYDDYVKTDDKEAYEKTFTWYNNYVKGEDDKALSIEAFDKSIAVLKNTRNTMDKYVKQFEYVFALAKDKGVFTGEELDVGSLIKLIFVMAGIDENMMDTLSDMDPTALINMMYYTSMGILPLLILIILLSNSLIANQVDNGSLAYILSTPTTRTAIVITHGVFMILVPAIVVGITCGARIMITQNLMPDANITGIVALYGGMYVLVESMCGICFLGSCLFNRRGRALAFGGGITLWCYVATLLGMFGTKTMVDLGMGVEELNIFNSLSLMGLYKTDWLATVGTDAVNYGFVTPLVVLAVIAIACYLAGAMFFKRKDLPL